MNRDPLRRRRRTTSKLESPGHLERRPFLSLCFGGLEGWQVGGLGEGLLERK